MKEEMGISKQAAANINPAQGNLDLDGENSNEVQD